MAQEIRTDVCIIGAGPSGLTIARELVGESFDVLVLESGEYEPSAAADDLAAGHTESPYYGPSAMAGGRRRQFGGTANNWVHVTWPGKSRVYARTMTGEQIDFETKSWQPGSGWPFDLAELMPYYDRTHLAWGGAVVNDSPSHWSRATTPELTIENTRTTVAQYAPADWFTLRARDELLAAPNVRVEVGSTVVSLDGERDGNAVRSASVVRSDGTSFTVTAQLFVLAGGGVENSQVLLSSELCRPGGPGNRYDNVGRYVTDHPEFRLGALRPSSPDVLENLGLYDLHYVDGQLINGVLTFDEEYKRAEQLLNVGAVFIPRRSGFNTDAERAFRHLKAEVRGKKGAAALASARRLLTNPGETRKVLGMQYEWDGPDWQDNPDAYQWYRGGWSRPGADRSQFPVLEVHVQTEQTPERENRLTLSGTKDALGRGRLNLKLGWSEADQQNLTRYMDLFARSVERAGLGWFDPWMQFDGPLRMNLGGIHHPMGGTRMHADPQLGVVDADSRVHGLENLYVAGSSVFPTSLGYVNPTLTIVAMSSRLADHVRATMTGSAQRIVDLTAVEAVVEAPVEVSEPAQTF
ncbi:FAD-dependent oxidoreductase [Spongisporangium articulatum]|uniref:FAD-dependent oxidoreductase n=1 Tax=Spongisporangium articulatum TaxID=3362603 RepID=A0ABW8AIF3_9ACTN